MIFPGEIEAVNTVLALADRFGYGNMIGHLKRAWAVKLMEGNERLDYQAAVRATNVSAYPQNWSIEALAEFHSRNGL